MLGYEGVLGRGKTVRGRRRGLHVFVVRKERRRQRGKERQSERTETCARWLEGKSGEGYVGDTRGDEGEDSCSRNPGRPSSARSGRASENSGQMEAGKDEEVMGGVTRRMMADR